MNAPAGWYPDPGNPHVTRYWDGGRYTHERHWNGSAWVDPPPIPPPTAPTPPSTPPVAVAPAAVAPVAMTPVAAAPVAVPPLAASQPVANPRPAVTINAEMLRGLPRTFWFFIAGAAGIALAAFFPLASEDGIGVAALNSGGRLLFLVCAGGIAYLAWPTMREEAVTVGRRWGLVGINAFIWLVVLAVWYALQNHSGVSAGLGQFLATIGAVCTTIGIVRVWRSPAAR